MGLLSKAAGKMTTENDNKSVPETPDSVGALDGEFKAAPPAEYAAAADLPGEIKNEIITYYNTYTLIHGIILSYPKNYDEKKEGETFNQQLNRIIATLGSAVPLPSGHSLVLFSNTIDRELLAHRLSKSLETETPVIFQADDIKTVVDYLRPYL
jgi:hypothetical protein